MKTPTEMIETADNIPRRLCDMRFAMQHEVDDLMLEWENLKAMGGGRDDHAAMLLGRLRTHLQEIARFAGTCDQQIEAMVADPFGRESAA